MLKDSVAQLRAVFVPGVTDSLVEALQRAYHTATEHHDSAVGGNEETFGFTLYHFAVHELCQAIRASEGVIVMRSRRPVFRFGVGDCTLACHRVGRSAGESIWSAFPNNTGAAHLLVSDQLWLPGLGREEAWGQNLVLAHLGNHEDGLGAIWVCEPGAVTGQRISAWAHAELLWMTENSAKRDRIQAKWPTEEVIEEPIVQRRRPADTAEGEA